MNIAYFQKTSFVNYPHRISCVVFVQGCNLKCPYCHNSELIPFKKGKVSENEIFEYFKSREFTVDAMVITGGEPTTQHNLPDFVKKVKNLGISVKLDTNGMNPEMLKETLPYLDYIAIDLKTIFDNYHLVGMDPKLAEKNWMKSFELIKKSNVKHEVRTTLAFPLVTPYHFHTLKEIVGDSSYFLQQYRKVKDCTLSLMPFDETSLNEVCSILGGREIVVR